MGATTVLHVSNWPDYRGWPLILNHIWAAVIANDQLPFKGWCPANEQDYYR
jgi:hypothetical protein